MTAPAELLQLFHTFKKEEKAKYREGAFSVVLIAISNFQQLQHSAGGRVTKQSAGLISLKHITVDCCDNVVYRRWLSMLRVLSVAIAATIACENIPLLEKQLGANREFLCKNKQHQSCSETHAMS